jgi:NAD(P)-dependent dehydrogenase (short-subunit alcohol dehydrogenase family)
MVAGGRNRSIINMASTNGMAGDADYAHYNASKAGVLLLTKSMAVELGRHGIRVNAKASFVHRAGFVVDAGQLAIR